MYLYRSLDWDLDGNSFVSVTMSRKQWTNWVPHSFGAQLRVSETWPISALCPWYPLPSDASTRVLLGEDSSLLRVTALGPGLYFLGLQKLRDWPRKFLDKWLLTGRGQGGVSLGTLLGIRTRLCDESVLLAALPHESSPGPSIIKPSVPAVWQPLCQAHTKMMKTNVTVPEGLRSRKGKLYSTCYRRCDWTVCVWRRYHGSRPNEGLRSGCCKAWAFMKL